MTIIEPNKNKFKADLLLIFLVGSVVLAVLFNIYLYNSTVNLKYLLGQQEKYLKESQVANADAKNALYQMLDTDNFARLAEGLGLIKESRPDYLQPYSPVAVLSN